MTPPAAAAAAGAASPATRARSSAPARPRVAPPRPRRVSGPARPPARPPASPPAKRSSRPSSRAQAERGLVPGLLGALDGVSRSGALDRLIRGRIWIGVITFALIGIVTLQLLVLQLNASIGRSLVREAQLQRANAALSIESSELSGGERVETQAAHLGMQLVTPGALHFLTGSPRAYIARAAAALKAPAHAASTSGEAGDDDGGRGYRHGRPRIGHAHRTVTVRRCARHGRDAVHDPDRGIGLELNRDRCAVLGSGQPERLEHVLGNVCDGGGDLRAEAPAGAAVAQAGGVGSGQPNGGG